MLDRAVFERGALIGGEWRLPGEARTVVSPYDQTAVGSIGWCGAEEARTAVDSAEAAMGEPLPAFRRAEILSSLAALVAARQEDFAELLAHEAGKPLRAGRVEAARARTTLQLCAEAARRLAGDVIPMESDASGLGKFAATVRVPVGVVAAITPFNFPLNLACHKLGPAIAAGCGVVLKPADKAPLAACLLASLALEAGLPPGWLNVVVGDPATIAATVADDDRVGLITFTGSAAVGWGLRARAPRKRVTLELGNATPVIVDETADAAAVGSRLAASAFGFSGQSCISTQRVYAHASVAEQVAAALAEAADALVVGDPLDPATDVGPLITPEAADRVCDWIAEARSGGARLLAGGERDGAIVTPTVLADAPAGSDLLRREAFGPVVAVQRYTTFEEAVRACNASPYGLQAGVFTRSLERAFTAARELRFGGVLVNEIPTFRADHMPYGGVKESGNTREGPEYAVREMTDERIVVVQPH